MQSKLEIGAVLWKHPVPYGACQWISLLDINWRRSNFKQKISLRQDRSNVPKRQGPCNLKFAMLCGLCLSRQPFIEILACFCLIDFTPDKFSARNKFCAESDSKMLWKCSQKLFVLSTTFYHSGIAATAGQRNMKPLFFTNFANSLWRYCAQEATSNTANDVIALCKSQWEVMQHSHIKGGSTVNVP